MGRQVNSALRHAPARSSLLDAFQFINFVEIADVFGESAVHILSR
jgi:hypothetical protein